jgi:RNA polymerase sigma-70 factor, ECF subfamily
LEGRYSFDADYLERLKQRDAATERHFATYFDALIRIKAIKAGHQSARASDDICQETLLRVLESVRRGRVEHPERLGAYVLAVSNNVIREYFRGDRRFVQLPERQEEVPSARLSVESELLNEERKDLMRRALAELGAKDQALLGRICSEDQDKDAICRDFGVTREYLRVLLHRARARLRAAAKGAT